MKIKKQIKILKELIEATAELNAEYQEGWEDTIEDAESLLKYLEKLS